MALRHASWLWKACQAQAAGIVQIKDSLGCCVLPVHYALTWIHISELWVHQRKQSTSSHPSCLIKILSCLVVATLAMEVANGSAKQPGKRECYGVRVRLSLLRHEGHHMSNQESYDHLVSHA